MRTWIDVGSGTKLAFFNGPGAREKGGMFCVHPAPTPTGFCEGTITFQPDGQWILVSEDPLTIVPSLDCTACGWHHCIQSGRVT